MSGLLTPTEWGGNWTESELNGARSVALLNRLEEKNGLGLLPALLSTSLSFRSRRWLREAPFLPLPDKTYLRWRRYTAYGDDRRFSLADLKTFAAWQRGVSRITGQS